jgi:heme A synthase
VATLGVILWGAWVRITGSGAGCGNHWPTCNGEIVPRAKSAATLIEFTHRATSGLAFLLVLAQALWAVRSRQVSRGVRRAAIAGLAFMIIEALVGAGLVVFEMVAGNKSVARGAWTAVHLLNTNVLLAMLTLVWLRAGAAPTAPAPAVSAGTSGLRRALVGGLVGLLVVGMSGAITALGDTLFPAGSLAAGLAADFSPTAHLFVRLRVWHPVLAATVGLGLIVVSALIASRDRPTGARGPATWLAALVLAQVALGVGNLLLLAPPVLQLLHLLGADLVWLSAFALAVRLGAFPPTASQTVPVG